MDSRSNTESLGRRVRNSLVENVREATMSALERAFNELEAKHAASMSAVTPGTLSDLADDYDAAATDQLRAAIAYAVAEDIPLETAGKIRRAAKAIELGTPGLIHRATANGATPSAIAKELSVTDSYVRRMIRETRQVSWRIDLFESEAGRGWQAWESGESVIPATYTAADLAEHVLSRGGRGPSEHRSRVLIWNGTDEQPNRAAIYAQEQDPAY
ncbi:hypothetical protein [Streptomyces sp. NBC_01237]|uniref:hypothetical protein n=1 Tax=Streptomyces sp. NBC_01237 TaxID=2903790 RepID=UPI002DDA91B7|nr:hypothetical protein [Streptomyces sp. NBC_01237]WRZ73792.1 hypothetical protein OG251_20340 [Streptomyces sp. NBC_01237]